MPHQHRERVLLEGLAGPVSLLTTLGLQASGSVVVEKTATSGSVQRVRFRRRAVGVARTYVYVNGDALAPTLERSIDVPRPANTPAGLQLLDAVPAWPPPTWPASLRLRWRAVVGADRYTIRDGSDNLLVTVFDDGRGYYTYTFDNRIDATTYTYRVIAETPPPAWRPRLRK
jgi:hypothetical protein